MDSSEGESFKLNVAEINDHVIGIFAIFRDRSGSILATATWKINRAIDARTGEALGMRFGLELAKDLCLSKVESTHRQITSSTETHSNAQQQQRDCETERDESQEGEMECSVRRLRVRVTRGWATLSLRENEEERSPYRIRAKINGLNHSVLNWVAQPDLGKTQLANLVPRSQTIK
ncbi:hypothetical protein E2542_SST08976 [Spatholobus suberectus]|nr:hypothetical protein E2542_SST08976 [Spatholobus suberectus]